MDSVIVRPAGRGSTATPYGGGRAMRDLGTTWLLDAVSLHHEFDDLFGGLVEEDGLAAFRERSTRIWRSTDPLVSEYVASLPTHTPDEWEAGFDEVHLAEWYRVLMGAYIRPAHGIRSPSAVKDRLPDLGWVPADARRLAWGRELASLAEAYAEPDSSAALALVLPLGNKGWLSQEDIADFLERLHTMDRDAFRDNQNLVPLVEEIYDVLAAVATVPDRVLLLPPS